MRPFRFLAPMPRLDQPAGRWRDAVRRTEDLGFATVSISDHFTRGWVMEPVVAMTAAAAATDRLRVLSLVLGNDYRHPVLVHKAMATLDVLSEGRVELGLGAGWMRSDYQAAGLPYDEPAERIGRLEESVAVLKGLFGPEPLTFAGAHYRIDGVEGLPKPVQRPHPPLLVGGGGRKVLSVAGRHADIVSVNPSLRDGVVTTDLLEDATAERIDQKVAWVREAAAAAGRRPDEVELQLNLLVCQVTGRAGQASRAVSSLAGGADPGLLEKSPAVLAGSVGQCVEALQERRERFGISYVNLGSDVEAVAPIVARLAGT
ncbi:MAG TPA: TIGR03621 family F420-dependent LLM class oxidoreductase [Actinomycetota bacterium]|nr:TIGR03621 family F420-dependent LLM class oxidoreductase [Actinomycetota bacterium]